MDRRLKAERSCIWNVDRSHDVSIGTQHATPNARCPTVEVTSRSAPVNAGHTKETHECTVSTVSPPVTRPTTMPCHTGWPLDVSGRVGVGGAGRRSVGHHVESKTPRKHQPKTFFFLVTLANDPLSPPPAGSWFVALIHETKKKTNRVIQGREQ